MAELADAQDLGDVTSVQIFHSIIRRAHSLIKAGSSCFIDVGQALCSASVPRRVKIRGE